MIFLTFPITLREPVKVGIQSSQNDSGSFSYLPGSVIRGGVISVLQKKERELDIHTLLQDVFFDPAYLCSGGQALFPVPPVWYATKHKIRQAAGKAFDVACRMPQSATELNPPQEGEQSAGSGKFGKLENGTILTQDTEKVAKLHIATEDSRHEKSMFRYEAIAPGQTFLGVIRTKNAALADAISRALSHETLFLGGSRSAGYGRCEVGDIERKENPDRKKLYGISEKRTSGLLTVYALSDLLLLDNNGVETGVPDPGLLVSKLHLGSAKLLSAHVTARQTLGFNHTWKAGPEIRGAVCAGSIWYYEIEGTPDPEAVRMLENTGIGLRRGEGYGSILIDPDFAAQQMEPLAAQETERTAEGSQSLDSTEHDMLSRMEDNINRARENAALRRTAVDCGKKNSGLVQKFSPSQINRLLRLLDSILQEEGKTSEDAAVARVESFRQELKTNTKKMYETTKICMIPAGEVYWKLSDVLQNLTNRDFPFVKFAGDSADFEMVSLTGSRKAKRSSFYRKAEYLYLVLYDVIRKEGDQ